MCGGCWEEHGSPTEWTPRTARFIELHDALYELEPRGGPLHAVLDDWNLDRQIEPYWPALGLANDLDDDDPDMQRIRDLCTEIAEILNGWTVEQRYAAKAYADNYFGTASGDVVKTRRAEIIDACNEAAKESGLTIIGQMPRMAEFYRKRVNEQLRAARVAGDQLSLNDAKAKLEMLRWVDGWVDWPVRSWPHGASRQERRVAAEMTAHLSMIGYSLRYLVRAYADHPQFRPEWGVSE